MSRFFNISHDKVCTEEPIAEDSVLQVVGDNSSDMNTEIVVEYTKSGKAIIRDVHQWTKEIDAE